MLLSSDLEDDSVVDGQLHLSPLATLIARQLPQHVCVIVWLDIVHSQGSDIW